MNNVTFVFSLLEPLCESHFYVFCIKTYIENQGEVLSTIQISLHPPPPTPHTHTRWSMLPTALWRWTKCNSYFVWLCVTLWFLIRDVLSTCFYVFSPVWHCDHLAWVRESWSIICFSCICLFILYVLLCVSFLFFMVTWVGCGMWLWHSLDFSFNFLNCENFSHVFRRIHPEVNIWSVCHHMSLVTRKPVFGVCDQVRLKPACSATETS